MEMIFRGGYRSRNFVNHNDKYKLSFEESKLSVALLSRDYKGVSNQPTNIVLEIYKVNKGDFTDCTNMVGNKTLKD